MLQSMGLARVGHDLVTEQQQYGTHTQILFLSVTPYTGKDSQLKCILCMNNCWI